MSNIVKIADNFYLNLDHVLYIYIKKYSETKENAEMESFMVTIDLTPTVLNGKDWNSVQMSVNLRSFSTQKEAEDFLVSVAEKCQFTAMADT
jgi:hypothetical protein